MVKDFLKMKSTKELQSYNFSNIEPFTIVVVDWNSSLEFIEVVWDGLNSYIKSLNLSSYIWSSSTLYNEAQKAERKSWFESFKSENQLNAATFLEFHKTARKGNLDFGVIMDRETVKTTSMTQIEKIDNTITMRFEEFSSGKVSTKTLRLKSVLND